MSDNNVLYDYLAIFTNGYEHTILAESDEEAINIAKDCFDVRDKRSWEYRTIHLIPECVYRMDDLGQFTIRVY